MLINGQCNSTVECQIVALKAVGSNPIISPKTYLAKLVDAADSKFVLIQDIGSSPIISI